MSAYRKRYGTNHVLNLLLNNPFTKAGFIDISKAFDCIPHDLLITNLHGYGLGFNTVTFLFTYFKGLKQKVSINISSLF